MENVNNESARVVTLFSFISLGISLLAPAFAVVFPPSVLLLSVVGLISSLGSYQLAKNTTNEISKKISITAMYISLTVILACLLFLYYLFFHALPARNY